MPSWRPADASPGPHVDLRVHSQPDGDRDGTDIAKGHSGWCMENGLDRRERAWRQGFGSTVHH